MARRSYLPLIALTALTVVVPSGSASACSCVPLSPEAVRAADGAAIAKLLRVAPQGDGRDAVFTYRIERVFEGRHRLDRDRIRVHGGLDSAACGLPLRKRRYGLVLDRADRRWTASLCSVTTPQGLRALAAGGGPARKAVPAPAVGRYCGGTRRYGSAKRAISPKAGAATVPP